MKSRAVKYTVPIVVRSTVGIVFLIALLFGVRLNAKPVTDEDTLTVSPGEQVADSTEVSEDEDDDSDEDDSDDAIELEIGSTFSSGKMTRGNTTSTDPIWSPFVDLSGVYGFDFSASYDGRFSGKTIYVGARTAIAYEFALSDDDDITATYERSFYPNDTVTILALSPDKLSLSFTHIAGGFMTDVSADNYFGKYNLTYFSAMEAYAFTVDDWRISFLGGAELSLNKISKDKNTGAVKLAKKAKLAFSNAFVGSRVSFDAGNGFELTASGRLTYTKEVTSNKKSFYPIVSLGIAYDIEF